MEEVLTSLRRFLPETVITVALLLVVVVDSTRARWRNPVSRLITVLAMAGAIVLALLALEWILYQRGWI